MWKNRQNAGNSGRRQTKPREKLSLAANASPILKAFHGYALEMEEKQDRYERIYKLSRDITTESKRIIFLLHSIDSRKQNSATVLAEAQQRLEALMNTEFRNIAKELVDQDVYKYRNAYTFGVQEFIEAYSFWEYNKHIAETEQEQQQIESANSQRTVMSDWRDLQQRLQYSAEPLPAESATEQIDEAPYQFFVDPTDYVLGIADLTGELMRGCINALGSGDTDSCFKTCATLQRLDTCIAGLNGMRVPDMRRKITTSRQNVLKAEQVCYNIRVRGTEAAKFGALNDATVETNVDEGFY